MASLPAKRQTDVKLSAEDLAAPITRVNFWPRVQHYVRHNLGSPDELPVIRPGTEDWNAWQEYFERHLQWLPAIMQQVLVERAEAMTVPTPRPEQFDLSFVPEPGYRLRIGWRKTQREDIQARRPTREVDRQSVVQEAFRAARSKPPRINNVFVAPTHALYPRMVERYDRGEGGKVGEHRGVDGLWVPLEWVPQRKGIRIAQVVAASRASRQRAEAAE